MRRARASCGWSHSNVTPTTSSPAPTAKRISVADGSSDTMFTPRRYTGRWSGPGARRLTTRHEPEPAGGLQRRRPGHRGDPPGPGPARPRRTRAPARRAAARRSGPPTSPTSSASPSSASCGSTTTRCSPASPRSTAPCCSSTSALLLVVSALPFPTAVAADGLRRGGRDAQVAVFTYSLVHACWSRSPSPRSGATSSARQASCARPMPAPCSAPPCAVRLSACWRTPPCARWRSSRRCSRWPATSPSRSTTRSSSCRGARPWWSRWRPPEPRSLTAGSRPAAAGPGRHPRRGAPRGRHQDRDGADGGGPQARREPLAGHEVDGGVAPVVPDQPRPRQTRACVCAASAPARAVADLAVPLEVAVPRVVADRWPRRSPGPASTPATRGGQPLAAVAL